MLYKLQTPTAKKWRKKKQGKKKHCFWNMKNWLLFSCVFHRLLANWSKSAHTAKMNMLLFSPDYTCHFCTFQLWGAESESVFCKLWTVQTRINMKWAEVQLDQQNDVRPVKTQISLCIRTVWYEYSLCTQCGAKAQTFLRVDNEDSDQTGRMRRLIWVFTGRTSFCFVLSCSSSKMMFVKLY